MRPFDNVAVFDAEPSLPGLSPQEYVAGFDRGFDAEFAPPDAEPRVRALFERRSGASRAVGSAEPTEETAAFVAQARTNGVGVAGAGLMGVSIAATFLRGGFSVLSYDPCEDALRVAAERARLDVANQRARKGEAEVDPDAERAAVESLVAERFCVTDRLDELATRSVVVESIPEKLKLKRKFYRELDRVSATPILTLTNTSSLQTSELVAELPDGDANVCRERFAAFHFFHPVAKRDLLEIAPCAQTSRGTLARACALARSIRKLPIVVGDGPGFLVNRLLQSYLNEALTLLDEGVPPERIEAVCRRIGMEGAPLRAIDEIGVDVSLHAGWSFLKAFPDRTHNSAVLPGLVREGRLGRKSRRGFYRYESTFSWADDAVLDCDSQTLDALRQSLPGAQGTSDAANSSDEELAVRILNAIYDEGLRAIDAGIVATCREVDAGLVLALGFPATKGGIFYWAG